jgi:hypothetical protein
MTLVELPEKRLPYKSNTYPLCLQSDLAHEIEICKQIWPEKSAPNVLISMDFLSKHPNSCEGG